jgi:hypothetical protein
MKQIFTLLTDKNMKNLFFTAFIGFLVFLVSCKKDQNLQETEKVGLSKAEILKIAKQYNLQDSIFKDNTKYGRFPDDPNLHARSTRTMCESYFEHWRKMADVMNDLHAYLEERKKITSMAEYYAVLESHPLTLAEEIKFMGGMEAYQKEKKRMMERNLEIYLDLKDGSFVFIPSGGYVDKTWRRLDRK